MKKVVNCFGRLKNTSYLCHEIKTDTADSVKRKMERLTYSTKEINRNFKIKVTGMYEGKKLHTLVGVSGMLKLIGDIDLTNRLLDRAFNSREDKCSCKLRRGIRIDFYVH